MTSATKAAAARTKQSASEYAIKVKRSSAGLGLFADGPIPKGVQIVEYIGTPITPEQMEKSHSRYLFAISAKKTIDGKPRMNIAGYINHSCKPNCEPVIKRGRVFIMSKRAIKPGEELAYNYGKEYFETLIKPHGCRCVKCTAQRAASAV
jgi:SET domain-containing protein